MYLISSGRRPLTLKFIDKFANTLKLNDVEKNHMILLASYNKTKSPSLKAVLFDKILENLDTQENIIEAKNYFKFTSSPTMPVIIVALGFDDIKGSVPELSAILKVSSAKVRQDLVSLEQMGLVKKILTEASQETFWKPTSKDLVITNDQSSNIMELFHQRTLKEASAILNQPEIFKRFRSILFAIDSQEHELLLSEIEGFISKIKNRFRQSKMSGKHIVKLNLNAYSMTPVK